MTKTRVHFTTEPGKEKIYDVGDPVEVYCDHEKDDDRVRDWLKGVVVQADEKMVAIQFDQAVYLTGGWMIPDHLLWCQQTDSKIRRPRRRRR